MAVPNASALAAVGGSDTGGGTTEVSAAQGGEGAAAPGASLSEADEGGEQESGDAVEPAKETAEAPAAGAQALSAEAEEQEVPEAEVPDAGGTAYGAMEAGEAWDGTTHDVSWYNAADTSFTITTAAQLAGLADITSPRNDYAAWQAGLRESRAAGITQDNFKGKTIVLGADIDMGGKRFDPISDINNWGGGGQGTSDGTYGEVAWQGTFDGAGHVVKNLKVDGSVNCSNNFGGYQGLISAIGIGGKVKTLGVTGTLKGRVVGGIVGCSNTDMGSGTSATLTMSMAEWPTIENCWTDVEIIGNGSGSRGCGGIFGGESEYRAACNIVNCYARGTVKNTQAGGVTGSTNGIVAGCYNTGSVSGSYTGSIVSTLFMPTGTTAQYKAVGFYGNNMALKGTNANVWRKGVTLTSNPEEVTDGFVTSDELKAGASTLGSGYLADENNATTATRCCSGRRAACT